MNNLASSDVSRRRFLQESAMGAAMGLMGGIELSTLVQGAPASTDAAPAEAPLRCAVVGLGRWGRELVSTLSNLPRVQLLAVCDHYPANLRRGSRLAPEAQAVEDAGTVLADPRIQAVVVATPSYLHRDLVIRALEAGRHVYCEAPLASSIADATVIAQAARAAAPRWVFQSGLQARSDPQRQLAATFFSSGVVGRPVMARAQWCSKQSWRQAAASPERRQELNWRLDAKRSLGLPGEVAVHHLDAVSWLFKSRPLAVAGFGSTVFWGDDGRDVEDTVQMIVEFPGGVRLVGAYTLASSFDAEVEVVSGTDATILFRAGRAWMFKELDAPLLGWEVHARQEVFGDQTGLVLVANASKQRAAGDTTDPVEAALSITPLQHALGGFVQSALDIEAAVEDFTNAYGTGDRAALGEHLLSVPRPSVAGWREGFESVVMAAKVQEAIAGGRRVEFRPEWFELG